MMDDGLWMTWMTWMTWMMDRRSWMMNDNDNDSQQIVAKYLMENDIQNELLNKITYK